MRVVLGAALLGLVGAASSCAALFNVPKCSQSTTKDKCLKSCTKSLYYHYKCEWSDTLSKCQTTVKTGAGLLSNSRCSTNTCGANYLETGRPRALALAYVPEDLEESKATGLHDAEYESMAAFEEDYGVKAKPDYDEKFTGDQVFYVYRNQEIPHPTPPPPAAGAPAPEDKDAQKYDVWSLANTNAGDANGVIYFMDGAISTRWYEVPVIDAAGYQKIVVKYYVQTRGAFGPQAVCNYGFCGYSEDSTNWQGRKTAAAHPLEFLAKRGIGLTVEDIRKKLPVGQRLKQGGREYSFPAEGAQFCGTKPLGMDGCSWKQLGIAKAVRADCIKAVVANVRMVTNVVPEAVTNALLKKLGVQLTAGTLQKLKRVALNLVKLGKSVLEVEREAFEMAFSHDEDHGGCANVLSNAQKMPQWGIPSDTDEGKEARGNPGRWTNAMSLFEHARAKPALASDKFTYGHLFTVGTFYHADEDASIPAEGDADQIDPAQAPDEGLPSLDKLNFYPLKRQNAFVEKKQRFRGSKGSAPDGEAEQQVLSA